MIDLNKLLASYHVTPLLFFGEPRPSYQFLAFAQQAGTIILEYTSSSLVIGTHVGSLT